MNAEKNDSGFMCAGECQHYIDEHARVSALEGQRRKLREALNLVILHDGKLTGADFTQIHAALNESKL